MTTRYAMAMDTRKCVGCSACVLACKAENALPDGACRSWIEHEVRGEFPHLSQQIRSMRCNQCDDAPCVTACPTGASFVAIGGIVGVTASKCTGCKACIASCPYDARYVTEEGHVDKCTFCLHLVERGQLPACVAVCPTKSLTFGDIDDENSEISQLLSRREWTVEHPNAGTLPNVFFLS